MRLGCVRGARFVFFHLFLFLKCDGTLLLPLLLHPEQAPGDLPARGFGVLFCFRFLFFFFLRCQENVFFLSNLHILSSLWRLGVYSARRGGRAADAASRFLLELRASTNMLLLVLVRSTQPLSTLSTCRVVEQFVEVFR